MKYIILTIITVFIIACTESATEVSNEQLRHELQISGALNTEFKSVETTTYEQKRDSLNTIFISSEGYSDNPNFQQQIAFKFIIRPDGGSGLQVGRTYRFLADTDQNLMKYQSSWGVSTLTELQFQITSGAIMIDRIDASYAYGRLQFSAIQKNGRRITHGQVEDLQLTHFGEISVNGRFSTLLH
jgi:hypothetical protein